MLGFSFIAKTLIILGAILILLGGIFLLSERLPWIGRFPGDIYIQKKGFTFYFPVVTCILISIVITLVLWLFGRR